MNRKQKKIRLEDLPKLEPRNKNQRKAIETFRSGNNLVMSGWAGTGKTYLALHLALEEILDKSTPFFDLVLVRSIVPTRDIGFLPGDEDEKKEAYTGPYKAIFQEMFGCLTAWDNLNANNLLHFESTSFIRGITYNNTIIVVDEVQNLNYHELASVITRVGRNCKIIFSGDYHQSDFKQEKEKQGILDFIEIISNMKNFGIVEFDVDDIVRSGTVKDFIINERKWLQKKSL
jgi:phosphate starvation-inducible PhoH-like protein